MKIIDAWPTKLATMDIELPQEMREVLSRFLEGITNVHTYDTYNDVDNGKKLDDSVYNLFDYSHERYNKDDWLTKKALLYMKQYEKISSIVIRNYIKEAWNIEDNRDIRVRCFGNVQLTGGRRTVPHFHHGWDGVLAHYLTVGNEFESEQNSEYQNDPRDEKTSGEFLLLDPRPSIRMPINEKAITFKPYVGFTLIHPAYLWHETETYTDKGLRVCLVINFNITTKNIEHLPTNLINLQNADSN